MTEPTRCPVFWYDNGGHACSLDIGHDFFHLCPHGDEPASEVARTGPWSTVPGQPDKASAAADGITIYTRNYRRILEEDRP